MFDSFSVFVEARDVGYSLFKFEFHKLPEKFPFRFNVLHNSTLGKILEIQLPSISARRATDCCRSPLLVAFKIPSPVLFSIQLTYCAS